MNKLLLGLSLLVLGFGCARESNNNPNTNANTGIYSLNQYGQCVSSTGLQAPSYSYCQQGQNVGAQQCYGPYSYNGQIYQCGIQNDCRGYTMINPQTGQQVLCQ